jgi:hypothetical protein
MFLLEEPGYEGSVAERKNNSFLDSLGEQR